MNFAETWLDEVRDIATRLLEANDAVEGVADVLVNVRERGGRVFVLGLGGSAANASHCVNDLRMRARIEAYAPTDNIAELTARCNDEMDGWTNALAEWLEGSRIQEKDAALILSGSGESRPLVAAAKYAQGCHASVIGILGRQGSTIGRYCRAAVVIPSVGQHLAGHAETFQSVVWHCLVAHPRLAA